MLIVVIADVVEVGKTVVIRLTSKTDSIRSFTKGTELYQNASISMKIVLLLLIDSLDKVFSVE